MPLHHHCQEWLWGSARMDQSMCKALGFLCLAVRVLPSIHPTCLELELGAVLTLAGCSVPLPHPFLSTQARSSFLFLLSQSEGPALRSRAMGTALLC